MLAVADATAAAAAVVVVVGYLASIPDSPGQDTSCTDAATFLFDKRRNTLRRPDRNRLGSRMLLLLLPWLDEEEEDASLSRKVYS